MSEKEEYKRLIDEGIYKIQEGKYSEAIEFINKSIELKKDWEISYFYRAVAYHALSNFNEAMLDYTKAIQLNPKMIDAYYNKSKIILENPNSNKQEIEKAIEDLKIAISYDEKFIDVLFALAAAYKKVAKYHDALIYLEKVLEIEPSAIHAKALKKLILEKYIV